MLQLKRKYEKLSPKSGSQRISGAKNIVNAWLESIGCLVGGRNSELEDWDDLDMVSGMVCEFGDWK